MSQKNIKTSVPVMSLGPKSVAVSSTPINQTNRLSSPRAQSPASKPNFSGLSSSQSQTLSKTANTSSTSSLSLVKNSSSPTNTKEVPKTALFVAHSKSQSIGSGFQENYQKYFGSDSPQNLLDINKETQNRRLSVAQKRPASKERYQTSENNPFLNQGFRFIDLKSKAYPEIAGTALLKSSSDAPHTRSLASKSSRSSSASKHPKRFNPNQLEDWNKKITQLQSKNNTEPDLKALQIDQNISRMNSYLSKTADKHAPKNDVKPTKSYSNNLKVAEVVSNERVQSRIEKQKEHQAQLRKKIEDLAKVEEALMERLRASQGLEKKAKDKMNMLSTLKLTKEDLLSGSIDVYGSSLTDRY